jgi:hypothetical protein
MVRCSSIGDSQIEQSRKAAGIDEEASESWDFKMFTCLRLLAIYCHAGCALCLPERTLPRPQVLFNASWDFSSSSVTKFCVCQLFIHSCYYITATLLVASDHIVPSKLFCCCCFHEVYIRTFVKINVYMHYLNLQRLSFPYVAKKIAIHDIALYSYVAAAASNDPYCLDTCCWS